MKGGRWFLAGFAWAVLLQGCGDGEPLLFPEPVSLSPTGTAALRGQVGEELLPAPEVELRDSRGNPAPGVEVVFSPSPGAGRITGTPVRSDSRGVARAQGWTLGEGMGIQRMEVQAPGVPTLFLEVEALPGPPHRLEAVDDSPEQVGRVGEDVGVPPAVRLTDRFGNPLSNRVVNFSIADGGSIQPASGVTDNEGVARVERWTLGPGSGLQFLHATLGELEPAVFSVEARPGPPAELVRGKDTVPSGVVGRAIEEIPSARVLDAFGNPVPGVEVRFEALPLYGTVSPSRVHSDSVGTATPTEWTLGTRAGPQFLQAQVDSLPLLRLEALALAGDARLVEPGSPLEQEAFVDSLVIHRPTVRIRDEFGNPVGGVEVGFQVLEGGGTISGTPATSRADGFAWASSWHLGPLPGLNRVEARVEGIEESVVFQATGLEVPRFDLIVEEVHLNQGSQRTTGGILPVAGRPGVLRVVVRATTATDASPRVRIRLRRGGTILREEWVSRSGSGVPVEPDLTLGTQTWNLPLQPQEIQPGLEVQVEVDPEGLLGVERRDTNRFPRNGGFASLEVLRDPDFRVRFIPVHQSTTGLTGRVDDGNASAFLDATWRLLPLGGLAWEVRSPFTTDTPALEPTNDNNAWSQILSEIQALRVAEGATDEYYYGVVQWPFTGGGIAGVAYILPDPSHPARSALGFDELAAASIIMAHELGHNLGRRHTSCGGAGGVDPFFPYPGGRIGVAGWDVTTNRFVPVDQARDLMGYCSPVWVSDYTFGAIRSWRQNDPLASSPAAVASRREEGILVWGRIDSRGPLLEPAFQVFGRVTEPEGHGPHRITLLDGAGGVLYRGSFPGTPVAHAEDPEERHFAFLLPLDDPARAAGLTTLRLETPFGTVERQLPPTAAPAQVPEAGPRLVLPAPDRAELTWDEARFPMALIRDRASGQILGLARGGELRFKLAPGMQRRDLQVLLSDGVRSQEVDPR
jgi:hypothetical protein